MNKLYVIFKDGRPFELPVEDGTAAADRLMDYDDGVDATFAFASTNLAHIRAMKKALPELLDADDDMGLEIQMVRLTPATWNRVE